MRVKSCWDSVGHGGVLKPERSNGDFVEKGVHHNPLIRPSSVK
jgi:hypothetical protein